MKPEVSNLKVFGCVEYVHVDKRKRKKFDPKSSKTVLDILMALKDISSLTCHLEVSLEVEI